MTVAQRRHPSSPHEARMYALLLVLTLAGWMFLAWRNLRGCQRVHRTPCGPSTRELWRQTYLSAPMPDTFPQPRERRLVVWRLAGLPLWTTQAVIALPLHMDAQIDHIDATTFDHHFCGHFVLHRHAPKVLVESLPGGTPA